MKLEADVDYLVAGTVFPTESKPHADRLLGEAGLQRIAQAVRVPVLAIGGVTLERIARVAAAGAAGIAAIGLFLDEDATGCRCCSLHAMAQTIRSRFDSLKTAP